MIYLLIQIIAKLSLNPNPNQTSVEGWVGFSSNSSSTRPTSRPASQRSTFKPQITIIVKRTFVSSVIKSQKKIILDLIPYHLPIHQTQKDLNLN